MTTKIVVDQSPLTCATCGLRYAADERWVQDRRDDHLTFYCPNGHSQWFPGEPEEKKLKHQLAERNAQLDAAKREVLSKGSMLSAERTKNRSLRKRIKNGVCPCCTRSFANLKRHIDTKHPTYAAKK